MRLVLLRSTTVHGRMMDAGDEFESPNKEAKIWLALAWAKEKNDGEEKEEADSQGKGARRKGSYKRRDFIAE